MYALCTVASRILFFWSCACGGWGEEDKRTRKAKQGKGNRKRDEEGKERKTQHYACRKRWRPEEKGSINRKTRKGEGAQEEKKNGKSEARTEGRKRKEAEEGKGEEGEAAEGEEGNHKEKRRKRRNK